MWAMNVLAAAFTILILTGCGILPAWKQPYPESAMRQALLVLSASAGWLLGSVPLCAALSRHGMPWTRSALAISAYAVLAAAAIFCIATGTDRNASALRKAGALITAFGFPVLYALATHRFLRA